MPDPGNSRAFMCEFDSCSSQPCQHDGTCFIPPCTLTNICGGDQTQPDGMFKCNCQPEYTSQDCSGNINECASNPCQHDGTCTDLINGYTCTCVAGFTGTHCETNINECSSDPCFNGECGDGIHGYECVCEAGYTGTHCEENIDECESNPCLNGGTCRDQVNAFSCECDGTGYIGTLCEVELDECLSDPCLNGGTCSDRINSYMCECIELYTGVNCDVRIDSCESSPCQHDIPCALGDFGYECNCTGSGYNGTNCETEVNECESNPCQNGGRCADELKRFSCECEPDFEGTFCELEKPTSDSNVLNAVLYIELVLIAVLAVPIIYFLVIEIKVCRGKRDSSAFVE